MKIIVKLLSVAFVLGLLVGCGGASYDDDDAGSRGSNNTTNPNSSKDITKFWFTTGGVKDAEIYTDNNSINVIDIAIEYDSIDTTPQVEHTGASYSPFNEAIDFAALPVTYTVTAKDNTNKSYDAIVRRAFVVSDASGLENAISTITNDIAGISYITIFVAQDIELTATDNITIPVSWVGKDIRLESNSTSNVTIKNLIGSSNVELIRVDIDNSDICIANKLCNGDGVDNIRKNPDGDYELLGDIDLSNYTNWEPIGNELNPFTGKLNGNGYTIKGLKFTNSNAKHIGLFGYIVGAEIKNLKVEVASNSSVELNRYNEDQSFGVLAGYSNGAHISRVTVSSSPSAPLVINKSGGNIYSCNLSVGGVVGYLHGGTSTSSALIERSASLISLNVTNTACDFHVVYVGGIAGWSINHATIENSYATGDISASGRHIGAGGIVGFVWSLYSTVSKSYASGAILANSSQTVFAGGIVGYIQAGDISNSAALNPSVAVRGGGNASRITNDLSAYSTNQPRPVYYTNNIAFVDMAVKRNGGQEDGDKLANNANGQGGANKVLADLQKQVTYGALGWNFSTIWDWNSTSSRPVLR
jgi:hypothetical protein